MNRSDTAKALARLGSAYRVQIDEGMASVWHDTIGGFYPGHAEAATEEWIRAKGKFPAPSEFLEFMQAAARRAAALGNPNQPELLPPSPRMGREASKTALRLLMDYLRQVPTHDHHRNAVCPACSSRAERVAAYEVRAAAEFDRLRAAGAFVAG